MKKYGFFLIIIILFSMLPITWFKSDFINGGDFSFPMANTASVLINYLNVWTDKWGLGFVNSRALPQAPFQFFLAFLNTIGIQQPICERIVFVALFGLSGLGMYLLTKTLSAEAGNEFIYGISALFYMFNPFNVIFYWHILDGMIFVYAFLPVMLALYLRWLITGKYRYAVLFYASSFFSGYTFSNPLIILLTWGAIFIFHFLIFQPVYKKIGFEKSIKFFLKCFIIWILLNAWWVLPLLSSINIEYSGLSTTIGLPWDTLEAFSKTTSLLNIFRLSNLYWAFESSMGGDPFYTYADVYGSVVFKIISFLIPFIIFLPLLFKKSRNRLIVFLSLSSLICIFLIKGSHSPLGKIFYAVIFKLPYMTALRAPVHKLGVLLCILYSILFGYGIFTLYKILGSKNKLLGRGLSSAVIILVSGVYSYPLWTGEVIHKGGKFYPGYHVKVPDYYSQVGDFLKEKEGGRFYSLPQCPTFNIVYNWEGQGYIGTDPAFNLFEKPGVYSTVDKFAQLPYTLLRDTNCNEVYKILSLMNVRFIILHNDVNEKLWDIFTDSYKAVSLLKKKLQEQEGISYIKSFGKLDVYKIDDKYFLPHIFPLLPEQLNNTTKGLDKIQNLYFPGGVGAFNHSLPMITFNKINPTAYVVLVENASEPFWLILSESFDKNWLLYAVSGDKNSAKIKAPEEIKSFINPNVKELKYRQDFYPEALQLFFKGCLPVQTVLVNGYANGWYIEPAKLKMGKTFVLTAYFRPQSYVYLGMAISIFTLSLFLMISLIRKTCPKRYT